MAEIEFSVLSRCCLRQRLPDEEALRREVQALVTERNVARSTINWRFNTQDARVKLHRLYTFDSKHDSLLGLQVGYRMPKESRRGPHNLPRLDV